MILIIARTIEVPVSIDPRRLSPIEIDTIWAPGATPFFSGWSGKHAAAIDATWVPWLAVLYKSKYYQVS